MSTAEERICLESTGTPSWYKKQGILRVPIGLLIVSVLSLIWIYVLPDPGVEFYKEVLIFSN